MATTSISLGEHWENLIQGQIKAGKYASVTEVIREALRCFEEREEKKLMELRALLLPGLLQAERGEFVENFSIESLIQQLDNRI